MPAAANPGLRLGAVLGAAARVGRDKCTLVLPAEIGSFGMWLEQLIAESTGKRGVGILPVAGEELGPPEVYGDDRIFVSLGRADGLDALVAAGHPVVELDDVDRFGTGSEVVRWEYAIATAGAVLAINPFDQPDVEAAKVRRAERGVSPDCRRRSGRGRASGQALRLPAAEAGPGSGRLSGLKEKGRRVARVARDDLVRYSR